MFEDQPALPEISPRAAIGLGVIPRQAGLGEPIYPGKLPVAEIEYRLEHGWRPYHRALAGLIAETRRRRGAVVLIDCQSMPSVNQTRSTEADFILGDGFGTSCRPELVQYLHAWLESRGHKVRRNTPYAGGFVTRHYGAPAHQVQVVQLEMARQLYMDETTLQPNAGFGGLRALLASLITDLRHALHEDRFGA